MIHNFPFFCFENFEAWNQLGDINTSSSWFGICATWGFKARVRLQLSNQINSLEPLDELKFEHHLLSPVHFLL